MCQFILGRKQDSTENWEAFYARFYYADAESFSSLPPPQLAIVSQSVVFNAGFYISRNTAKNLISSLMTH